MEWKDQTSYGRGTKERIPSVLVTKLGNVDVMVHRHIHYDGWLLSSRYLNIEKEHLDFEDLESCQKQAVRKVAILIEKKMNELHQAREEIAKSSYWNI